MIVTKDNSNGSLDSENYDSNSSELSSEGSEIYFTYNESIQNAQDDSEPSETSA